MGRNPIEKIAARMLEEKLGDYLQDFDSKALHLSAFKGQIQLDNLKLKPECLDDADLPIVVKHGFLGKLRIKLKWSRIWKEPVIVTLEDLYIVAAPVAEYNMEEEQKRRKRVQRKRLKADDLRRKFVRDAIRTKVVDDKKSKGKLAQLIMDNLQIQVRNIHIVFEDSILVPSMPYSLGIFVKELRMYSCDPNHLKEERDEDPILDFKNIHLENFGIYFNADVNGRWFGKFLNSGKEVTSQIGDVIQLLSRTIPDKSNMKDLHHRYVLKPVSGKVEYERTEEEPLPEGKARTKLKLNSEQDIHIVLDSTQLTAMRTIMEYMRCDEIFPSPPFLCLCS